jgi:isopentenyl-diphosphate delta-isomerase
LNPGPERGSPADDPDAIPRRKADHLRLATSDQHQAGGAGWEDIHLVHDALPIVDAAAVDLGAELLGRALRLPLVIAGMTGGHPLARDLNAVLARAAERHGLVMGLGSQRAALRDPSVADTYAIARQVAPHAVLLGNVGVSQLVDQEREPALTAAELRDAVDMIAADGLVVHLNYLEESVQPEGQRRAAGVLEAIARVVHAVDVPVVLKETGAGISREVALRARDAGVAAIDVGGHGGTSFASIEAARAAEAGDQVRARLGRTFAAWGIPTPASVAACADVLPVIATGGLRSGLDAARAIALGATAVGIGRPLLQAAMEGADALDLWIEAFEQELRTALFLTGSRRLDDLRSVRRVITGTTATWLAGLTDRVATHDDRGRG